MTKNPHAEEATLSSALARAQAEMSNPTKNAVNGHFRSQYADLAACRDAVLPVLARHGIALVQMAETTEDGRSVTLRTTLLHGSERLDCGTLRLPLAGQNLSHALGSALTYMRRYALCAVAGVAADDDDDGNRYSPPRPRERAPAPAVFADLKAALSDAFGPGTDKRARARADELSFATLGRSIGAVMQGGDEADARALLGALEG